MSATNISVGDSLSNVANTPLARARVCASRSMVWSTMPSFGNSLESVAASSRPVIPGMWLSSTSTSGLRSRTKRSVVSPSPASPTRSMPCSRDSLNRSSLRVASSSSATTTRILTTSLYGEPPAREKRCGPDCDCHHTSDHEQCRNPGDRDDGGAEERPRAPTQHLGAERRTERATLGAFVRGAACEYDRRGGHCGSRDADHQSQRHDDDGVRLQRMEEQRGAAAERSEREHAPCAAPVRK